MDNNKIVLVVGASSEIGCEIIRQISDGHTIILAHYFLSREKLISLQLEIKCKLVLIQADLSIESSVDSLVDAIASDYDFPGKIVFLSAPNLELIRFKDLKWSDFKMQLDIQLFGAYKILNRFLPKMSAAKSGKIVFILTSNTLGVPAVAMSHYVTAKYALLGLMKSLASEFSGKHLNINAVSPSMVETEFISQIPTQIVQLSASKHPKKRNALPSDVAPMVRFLLSDEANYITGVNIPLTGGASL